MIKKTLYQVGTYISGTRICEMQDGRVEKHCLYVSTNRVPRHSVQQVWDSVGHYYSATRAKSTKEYTVQDVMAIMDRQFVTHE